MDAPLTMEDAETRVEQGDRIEIRNSQDREKDRLGNFVSLGDARAEAEKIIGANWRVSDGYWKNQSPGLAEPVPKVRSVVWEFLRPPFGTTGWQVVWSRDKEQRDAG